MLSKGFKVARSGDEKGAFGFTYRVFSLFSSIIFAATATGNLAVSANIVAACNTVSGTMAFGNYDPDTGSNVDVNGSISVTCNLLAPYTIALNAGSTAGGTFTTRLMTDGTSTLAYNLYTTAGRTTVWGNGTGGTATVNGTGLGVAPTASIVYGRIPPGQAGTAGSGAYTDTVTITVTY